MEFTTQAVDIFSLYFTMSIYYLIFIGKIYGEKNNQIELARARKQSYDGIYI